MPIWVVHKKHIGLKYLLLYEKNKGNCDWSCEAYEIHKGHSEAQILILGHKTRRKRRFSTQLSFFLNTKIIMAEVIGTCNNIQLA